MIVIFSFSQSPAYTGFYAIARMVGELPITLLSSALGPVFSAERADTIANSIPKRSFINEINLILKLFITVVIPSYLFLSIWSEKFFHFLFGENWEKSGNIFFILLPISIISLLDCWLIRLFEVMGRQKISFFVQFLFQGTGFIIAITLIYFNTRVEIVLTSMILCFSFVQIFTSLFTLKMLGFKGRSVQLIAFIFILFSVMNGFLIGFFPTIFSESITAAWLLISVVSFLLVGQYTFKNYSLNDFNVFFR